MTTERAIGMSMGPIPFCKIAEYSEQNGLNRGSEKLFESVIRAMDGTYVAWSSSQQQRARDQTKEEKK